MLLTFWIDSHTPVLGEAKGCSSCCNPKPTRKGKQMSKLKTCVRPADYLLRYGGAIERRLCDRIPRMLALVRPAISHPDGDELAQASAATDSVEAA
jgi:hypothetical protein